MRQGRRWVVGLAAVVCLALVVGVVVLRGLGAQPDDAAAAVEVGLGTAPGVDPQALRFGRLTDPARTVVRDGLGNTVAVLTDNARTVRLTGPTRTFAEPDYTPAVVSTDAWVRLAPQVWRAGSENQPWFRPWLTAALADRGPDVLAVTMEYVHGAPDKKDAKGVRYAGDASFGPLSADDPDGRAENSDFLDYLGIGWTFADGRAGRPNPTRYGDLDCSGFLRLVYGYRLGYPLLNTNTPGPGLPRRAYAIADLGPGVQVIANRAVPAKEYDRLQPGDLVFFNTEPATPRRTDHSGIFLGIDDAGHYRFISSRSKADGPTFGDFGGASLLDGSGYWALRFRTARRI